jgi:hypothetical protein
MAKILKIDDEKVIVQGDKKIQRFIFNDDKVVKVDLDGKVLTSNAADKYLNLISVYNANSSSVSEEELASKSSTSLDLEEKKMMIKSGAGSGVYGFLGFLCSMSIIGPVIAYVLSFKFLEDISDREYLISADVSEINKRKGFFAWGCGYGAIVSLVAMGQWSTDMVSVIDENPTKPSINQHIHWKVWWPVAILLSVISIFTR